MARDPKTTTKPARRRRDVAPTTAKRRADKPASSITSDAIDRIDFVTTHGVAASIDTSRDGVRTALQQAAIQWSYILRNRRRWAGSEESGKEQRARVRGLFERLGLNYGILSESTKIEVRIPYRDEATGWESRIFPWEYALSAATTSGKRTQPLTVVRHLHRIKEQAPSKSGNAKWQPKVAFVESAPGELSKLYEFNAERNLVRNSLKPAKDGFEVITTPTSKALSDKLGAFKPNLIHLTGWDIAHGRSLGVPIFGDPEGSVDGFLLRHSASFASPVKAEELASILTASPRSRPELVCFNVFNSAARTAALTVARGAKAALGFQDEFEDSLSELFFGDFYQALRLAEGDVQAAFELTWRGMRAREIDLRGTGIVLWSSVSAFATKQPADDSRSEALHDLVTRERIKPLADAQTIDLKVDVRPVSQLNYSMIHNGAPLFERFLLTKPPGCLEGVEIDVELYAGHERLQYRAVDSINEPSADWQSKVVLPLTAQLMRSLQEQIRTTMSVCVKWKEFVHRSTHVVKLLPIDEWRDDDENRVWLPSFVLPRDVAVAKIIAAAQRYLAALADDVNAGFDGYQSVDETAEDPSAGIDLQVRAIWHAILNDFPLGYINPPPTYTAASQRLRRPGDVLRGGRGTCIDLALLLAACLEYIEIYPVIFLLEGHAFPGYWRSEKAYDDFCQIKDGQTTSSIDATSATHNTSGPSQSFGWYFRKGHYDEIVRQVHRRTLVPLESVWLTQRGSFAEAIDEGFKNLRSKREFHSMLDVLRARRDNITPLPVCGDTQ